MIAGINIIRPYVKTHFEGHKKCFVKDLDGRTCETNIKSPCMSKYYWYLERNGEILGDIQCSKCSSEITGDNYPEYYKGREYLFINRLNSNKQYKGIGTELVKIAIKESQRRGMGGRVCLNATTTNANLGSPVPFYYKMGFESSRKDIQRKIEDSMASRENIPKEYESTTMFLPEDKILKNLV